MQEDHLCAVCTTAANQPCSGCGAVFYCNKDHQRDHWRSHRSECQPFRVASSPEAGQYLVAGRQLESGQLILRDSPLVVGPLVISPLVCLGCSAVILDDDFYKCPQCFWPLCCPECATKASHAEECCLLAQDEMGIGPPSEQDETSRYDIIMLLRCLLLRSTNPPAWEIMTKMASHFDERMEVQEHVHKTTVGYVIRILKVDYDEEIVNRIYCAIATNSLVIRSEKGTEMRALYPRVRLLNHSCIPNVHLTCSQLGDMEIRTAVPVAPGMPLHICYTGSMVPFWERQATLYTTYCFKCACSRCEDLTEVGTYFSFPSCPECKAHYLQPLGKTMDDPWKCQQCNYEQSLSEIKENIKEWLSRLQSGKIFKSNSTNDLIAGLNEVETAFHPNHYVWMKAAQAALCVMRNNCLTIEAKTLRKGIWIKLLSLYGTFEPGQTRRRGMSLLETANALYEVLEHDSNGSVCSSDAEAVVRYCLEASRILGMEPPDSMEAPLVKKAEDIRLEAEKLLAKSTSGNGFEV